jgi:ferredoxin
MPDPTDAILAASAAAFATVMLAPHGWTFAASPGETVLAAAERAGIEMPNSCRNGTCRTCLCRLAQGSVRYLVDWPGLSLEEKREGCILPCVAVPEGDVQVTQPVARKRAPG